MNKTLVSHQEEREEGRRQEKAQSQSHYLNGKKVKNLSSKTVASDMEQLYLTNCR